MLNDISWSLCIWFLIHRLCKKYKDKLNDTTKKQNNFQNSEHFKGKEDFLSPTSQSFKFKK